MSLILGRLIMKFKMNIITSALITGIFSISAFSADNIIVDSERSKNTQVTKDSLGIDTISIENPNEYGLSVNYYENFNVPKEGVNIDNTQAKASAILNEVTSNQASLLNGNLAVLGNEAKLIIANPNGVVCNGCQFTGTNDISLVSGNVTDFNSLNFNLSESKIDIRQVNNRNISQNLNIISNFINFSDRNQFNKVNIFNGYQNISFEDYTWKGIDEAKGVVNINENARLKFADLSITGGNLNLDGKIITSKIRILKNNSITSSEKSKLSIASKKDNKEGPEQYIESKDFQFKGKLNIINSNVVFNFDNVNISRSKKYHNSGFLNSAVLFNSKNDNNYSGIFSLEDTNLVFQSNKILTSDDILSKQRKEYTDTDILNDVNLKNLHLEGNGAVLVVAKNILLSDFLIKFNHFSTDGNKLNKSLKLYLAAENKTKFENILKLDLLEDMDISILKGTVEDNSITDEKKEKERTNSGLFIL